MTCQQLRHYFKDPLRLDIEFRGEAEHVAECRECARFVQERRELAATLRVARESVPQFPGWLDDVALTYYRRQAANYPSRLNSRRPRLAFSLMVWIAAVVASALVAAGLLSFSRRKTDSAIIRPQTAAQPSFPSQPVTAIKLAPLSSSRSQLVDRSDRRRPASSVARKRRPAPAGFRSLIYCDELSCGGALQVIRLQLPSPFTPFVPISVTGSRTVLADVLIGPDGIARGIQVFE